MKGMMIVAGAAVLAVAAGLLIPEPQPRSSGALQASTGRGMRVVRVGSNYEYGWKAATPDTPKN